jgi:hypothetical protein
MFRRMAPHPLAGVLLLGCVLYQIISLTRSTGRPIVDLAHVSRAGRRTGFGRD